MDGCFIQNPPSMLTIPMYKEVINEDNNQIKPIIVLGMHRSGTSLVTRLVSIHNYEVGKELIKPVKGDNDKGYWENSKIVNFNNYILQSSSLDYYGIQRVVNYQKITSETNFNKLNTILSKSYKTNRWVLKDPRISLLLPFYNTFFKTKKIKPTYIIVVRHPIEVHLSLTKREEIIPIFIFISWARHYINILENDNQQSNYILYDDIISNPNSVSKIITNINPNILITKKIINTINEFIDPKLKHQNYKKVDIKDYAFREEMKILIKIYEDLVININNINIIKKRLIKNLNQFINSKNIISLTELYGYEYELKDTLNNERGKIKNLKTTNNHYKELINTYENKLSLIHNSMLWKITTPLRKLSTKTDKK